MRKRTRIFAAATLFVFFAAHERAHAQAEDAPRYEVGAQFSSLTIREPTGDFRTEPGFGGRFTFNINDSLALETQLDYYPNDNGRTSEFTGGRTTTAFFGVKAGRRFERFGIFGKARPGFVRFERTLTGYAGVSTSPPSLIAPQYAPRIEFATDIGGVLEFYPARRIVTRFDIGDTIIRYPERTITFPSLAPGTPPTLTFSSFTLPGETKHNFQFSAGIGFRF